MNKGKFSCAVLAGGQSRRFGSDKTVATIKGVTFTEILVKKLLKLSDDVLVVSKNPEKFNFNYKNLRFIKDEADKQSPLIGIVSALNNARYETTFIVAADTPFLSEELVIYLWSQTLEYDLTVTKTGEKINTLFGFYHRRKLNMLSENISKGNYKLIDIYSNLNVNIIKNLDILKKYDTDLLSFFNINSQEDYAKALETSKKINLK